MIRLLNEIPPVPIVVFAPILSVSFEAILRKHPPRKRGCELIVFDPGSVLAPKPGGVLGRLTLKIASNGFEK